MSRLASSSRLALCLVLFSIPSFAEVTRGVLTRVFRLRFGPEIGSCFAIEVENRQYIITATHLLDGKDNDGRRLSDPLGAQGQVDLWQKGEWKPIQVTVLYKDGTDIAVLIAQVQIANAPDVRTSGGVILSQEAYFLGFPFGLTAAETAGFSLPYVKRGIVSALHPKLTLDAINNEGFSGGPVVVRDSDGIFRFVGVVTGYLSATRPVRRARPRSPRAKSAPEEIDQPTGLVYKQNLGLVGCEWLDDVLLGVIRANGSGPEVTRDR